MKTTSSLAQTRKKPKSAPNRKTKTQATVKVRRLPHAADLPLPHYQTADAAGMDLVAAVPADAAVTLAVGQRVLIATGLIFELPPGTEAQVRPRSGLAIKSGVTVLNSPGTIDADYRGEVSVILINLGTEPFVIARGDRIAQMVIAPVTQASLREVTVVSTTKRGAGGFGSTGVSGASPQSRGALRNVAKKKAVASKAAKAKPASQKASKNKRSAPTKRRKR